MLTVLVAGSSNIIYPVCTLWPPYPWPSSEIGSCGLGELGLHLGQKTWAGGAQDFYPQPCRAQILNLRAWESSSSPPASPASVEAAMNQQQISPSVMQMLVCTNHPLPALEDTLSDLNKQKFWDTFFFLSCFGDSIRKIRCNNSSYLLVFTISR